MKKKVFSLLLAVLLIVAVLFGLTACDDEESSSKKKSKTDTSSAESVIEAFVDAINDQDAGAVCDLIDLSALGKMYDGDINKKDFKSGLKDFFDKYDDLEIKVSNIKHLKKDKTVLNDLLDYYDSYEEYIEDMEDESDIKGLTIYTADVEVPDEYEDLLDGLDDFDGRDVIFMVENEEEFKLVFTRLVTCFYGDYMEDNHDYDDDDDYSYSTEPTEEAKKFNKTFEAYEGNGISGKKVKEFLDKVITSNEKETYNHVIYVSYYDKDGYIDQMMETEKSKLNEMKAKIEESHDYKIEFDTDFEGYTRYVDIYYVFY